MIKSETGREIESYSEGLVKLMEKDIREEMLKLDHQICFPLYAAARKVTGSYAPFLKPLGLTYTQYLVMLVLWETDEVMVGELTKRLLLDTGTVTPLLKKMEEHGLLVRRRCPDDERCVRVSLTEQGKALKEKALDIPVQMASCVSLSQEEALQLYQTLYKILGIDK